MTWAEQWLVVQIKSMIKDKQDFKTLFYPLQILGNKKSFRKQVKTLANDHSPMTPT